ncbi:MAG: hypothetical protein HQM08_25050 [Candidatus Riflebacteria bacterium]|nr:hypothetical protein [Candidatus Riflebacteria bacterium]
MIWIKTGGNTKPIASPVLLSFAGELIVDPLKSKDLIRAKGEDSRIEAGSLGCSFVRMDDKRDKIWLITKEKNHFR